MRRLDLRPFNSTPAFDKHPSLSILVLTLEPHLRLKERQLEGVQTIHVNTHGNRRKDNILFLNIFVYLQKEYDQCKTL